MHRRSFLSAVGGAAAGLVGAVAGLARVGQGSVVYHRETGMPDVIGPGLRQMIADANKPVTEIKSLTDILSEIQLQAASWTTGQPNTIGNLNV